MILTYKKGKGDKIHISIDGEYALTVEEMYFASLYLKDGQEISEEEYIEPEAQIREYVMMSLRLANGINRMVFEARFGQSFEKVEEFFNRYYKQSMGITANPIRVTGEGAVAIKGVAEHVARRLNRLTQIVSPDQPYFDKPMYSSRIALLNTATKEGKRKGILQAIFGGKRK